jgi:hypothetical protein
MLYLLIIWVTYSWMIAAPRRWLLESQIDRMTAVVTFVDRNDKLADRIAPEVTKMLNLLRISLRERKSQISAQESPGDGKSKLGKNSAFLLRWVPLNALMATQQTLNGLNRQRALLVPESDLAAYAEPVFLRLSEIDGSAAYALRAQFDDSKTASARRIIIASADEICHARDEIAMRSEYDRERASLWLALVGLWAVIAIGTVLGHTETMLMGAIGGFLAPLINARRPNAQQVTWGVRVLSPVGGALTAVGGLLVVNLLADPKLKLLGEVFAQTWGTPDHPIALALALLFGFSGRMFSSMAITASSQIAGSGPPEDPEAAGGAPLAKG